MNAFSQASLIEARAMAVLLPYLKEQAFEGRVVLTSKGTLTRFLQECVGDAVLNTDDATMWAVEIKAEQRHTGNLFLETWSNRNLDDAASHAERGCNPGWLTKIRADILLYYFLETDDLYSLPVFRLKRWAFGTSERPTANLYRWKNGREEFREVGQNKYSQRNDTLGRLVPIDVMTKEVGLRHTKARQLSLPNFAEVA